MLGGKAGLCVQLEKLGFSHLRPAPVQVRASTSHQIKRMRFQQLHTRVLGKQSKDMQDITILTLQLRWAGTGREDSSVRKVLATQM